MATPTYTITQNSIDSHQSTPNWVVAFVRFSNPAAGYAPQGDILATEPILVVENDCLSVSVNNEKSSFAKMCTLTMKAGDIYYLNAVSPGDWVCVWINDSKTKIDEITTNLYTFSKKAVFNEGEKSNIFNNWFSGLKFVGRVVGVTSSDSMQGSRRVVNQTISCQAFLELATSVYFTTIAKTIMDTTLANVDDKESLISGKLLNRTIEILAKKKGVGDFASKFWQYLSNAGSDPDKTLSPDRTIFALIVLLFGIERDDYTDPTMLAKGLRGNLQDAIQVPRPVAQIVGQPNANRLWNFYNVYLGMQTYGITGNPGKSPWKSFSPITNRSTENTNIMWCPERCKGYVLFQPPLWANVNIWAIFNQYLNPTLNEMYTVLKCDQFNRIRPTIVVREIPFGTGLFDSFQKNKMGNVEISSNKKSSKRSLKASLGMAQDTLSKKFKMPFGSGSDSAASKRSMYHNVPRWIIDESMIYSVNITVSEHHRVNFVQVWGKNISLMGGIPPTRTNNEQTWRENQLKENYVIDEKDVARNGLRADIQESSYDLPSTNGIQSRAPLWAKMRADWLFNGHLMPEGTIVCNGINEPICEGDNVQIRGIVYHIIGVSHSANLDPASGHKSFRTILRVTHGILASSLTSAHDTPAYPIHQSQLSQDNPGPGITDYETKTGRDSEGNK